LFSALFPPKKWMDRSRAEEEIRALEERLRLADASPEPDTTAVFRELFADDVLMVGPGGSFGLEGVLDGHRPPNKRRFSAVRLNELVIRDLGDGVATSVRIDYTVETRSFALRIVKLWRRVGTGWKVVLVSLMTIPSEPPTTDPRPAARRRRARPVRRSHHPVPPPPRPS
jgi:hypothetical protein